MPLKDKKLHRVDNKLRDFAKWGAFVLIFLFLFSLSGNFMRIIRTKDEITKAEEDLMELEKENEALKSDLEYIKSDLYKEKQLRDELGLAKEGEVIVVLPEENILKRLAPKERVDEASLPEPNWKKWMDLFM